MIPLALRLTEIAPEAHLRQPHAAPAKRAAVVDAEAATEKLQNAFERGREAGRLEQEQAFVAELAEERRAFDQRLKSLRDDWTAHQAVEISRHITEALAAIEARLADSVTKILEPFLKDALKQKAIGDFCAAVREAFTGNREPALEISGPQDLLDAIATQLGPLAKTIGFTPADACAVSARSGMTVFESELARWLSALQEQSS